MGVHGLWKLLEPVGKIVPLEGMAGKVLAIDVSIWLHQAMKGMHDAYGAPVAIAHLLILFHRLCKLLFYKIKPVFVFDGGVPALKRETMATRRRVRTTARNEALKVRGKLFKNLLKHEAVRQMLSHGQSAEILGLGSLALPGSSVEEELYRLPPLAEKQNEDGSDEELSSEEDGNLKFAEDIHTIDVTSSDFKSLPAEVRHEILLELIETRKQSSWKTLDKMPKESDSFSDYQMNRLLKRRAVQSSLDDVGKEMGGRCLTMKDLEGLLLSNPESLQTEDFLASRRVAQSDDIHYLLLHKKDEVEAAEAEELKITTEVVDEFEAGTVPDVEIKEEELTQREIYDLIKKENEESRPETKLTGERKIRLTDDVIEILPLLGAEGAAKLRGLGGPVLGAVKSEVKDVAEEGKEEDGEVKVENLIMQNGGTQPTTNNEVAVPSPPSGSPPCTEVEPIQHEHSEEVPEPPSPKTTRPCSEERQEKVETTQPHAATPEDSVQVSEDSDTDFVEVPDEPVSIPAVPEPVRDEAKPQNASEQPIEIVIDTKKDNTESEDIFSDVFDKEPSEDVEGAERESIPAMTEGELQDMQRFIESEYLDLMKEQGKQERAAQSISDQMNLDAQELLRLFGVPFVVAPMEAEAQCAILNLLGLTDGTITDDSDIWLFGGKVVYKNFFNQKKHVHQYRSEDIQKCFKLTREDLIKIALLVGSDYTSGLEGIGPVTALEVLAAFPSPAEENILTGLKNFREWMANGSDVGPIRRSLRKKIRNTKIIPGFPSEAVLEAYMNPQVDDSKEPFSWAKPNVTLLQKYAKAKFGWNAEKCDELLTPVMKKLAETKTTTTLDKYFSPLIQDAQLEGVLSKRVENALKHLRNEQSNSGPVEADESEPERKRRKPKKSADDPSTSGKGEAKAGSRKPGKDKGIPQKVAMEKLLEDRKKSAIQIFKKSAKTGKQKTKRVVKKEADLSESSSD